MPSPAFAGQAQTQCGLCQRAHPPFERAVAYGSYEGGLRDLVHLLKYQQVRPAADTLGRLLAEALARFNAVLPAGPMTVIPVPLHHRKQGERGFNQSELIARAAVRYFGREQFRVVAGVLQRSRDTGSQIGLTRHQRRENLRGAFAVRDPSQVIDQEILLVDDVFTTGTTASECSKVLRRAGAKRVWVATVARTLKASAVLSVTEPATDAARPHVVAASA